jgi:endonuclease YncB( thermonuclease family)
MANLEKRIADLEAKTVSTAHQVRMYLCNDGEDAAQARIKAGIAPDYKGKTVRVQFVSSPLKNTP